MKKLILIASISIILVLFSCSKDPESNKVITNQSDNFSVELQYNGNKYNLGETITVGNIKVKLDVFMFLMNKPSFVSGTDSINLQDIMLIDMDPNININSPSRDLKRVGHSFLLNDFNSTKLTNPSFSFGLGSPKEINGEFNPSNYNPGKYAKGHPLAYGMGIDWDGWKMYRHIRIEGFCDSVSKTSLRYPIKWHTGFDSLYFVQKYAVNGNKTSMKIIINLNSMFGGNNPIKLPEEKYTEMGFGVNKEAEIGIKLSHNLANSISF